MVLEKFKNEILGSSTRIAPVKVCVIGGAGFIGSNLVDKLIQQGYQVLVLDNFVSGSKENINEKAEWIEFDIRDDYQKLAKILKEHQIQDVYHLAAEPYIPECFERPKEFFEVNAVGTLNVLMACKEAKIRKLMYYSSSEVYGSWPGKISEKTPTNPHSTYAVSKLAGDRLCFTFFKEHNLPVIILRQFNCFSGDTDVLTPDGIRKIKDLKVGDKIYTLNPETFEVEIDEVVDTQERLADRVFQVKHKFLDYIITADHKLFLKNHHRNNFHFYTLEELLTKNNQYNFPIHKPLKGTKTIDEKKLKLLAWYISEGYLYPPYEIRICQSEKSPYYQEIVDLIRSFKGTLTITPKYLALSDRELCEWVSQAGKGACNKRIPEFVFQLKYELRKLFQDTLMKGDGNKKKNRYSTCSWQLAQDFARLCLINGQSVCIRKEKYNSFGKERVIYRIHFDRKSQYSLKTKKHIKPLHIEMPVYDITAKKNHIIFAGRNGKFNWIGQCYGPRETHEYVIPEIISQLSKSNVVVLGNVKAKRDFIYVEDAVEMAIELMKYGKPGEIYNLGSGRFYAIDWLAFKIAEIMGKKIELRIDPKKFRPYDVEKLWCDNSKICKTIKRRPRTPIEEGLKKTIDWYYQNGQKWGFEK